MLASITRFCAHPGSGAARRHLGCPNGHMVEQGRTS